MDKFWKNKYFWLLLAITLLGFFLRSYHHGKLLFFEVDQARDWRVVEITLQNGIGELPLLGPGMNASTFRIGPMYHYIQYVAALIFGNTPPALAYPDLLFSVLTIPLFYFFSKEYFSKKISIALSLLMAVSLFAVEYGRFAMNSNALPFFTLLIFYPLLRLGREKESSRRWIWIGLASLALGTIMQLHALSLLAMPIIAVLYIFISRTKLFWKEWLMAILVVLLISSPVIINEVMSEFQDFQAVSEGVSLRQTSRQNFSPTKRVLLNSQEIVRNYALILTSQEIVPSLDNQLRTEGGLDMLKRNFGNPSDRKGLFLTLLGGLFFLFPAVWLFKQFFRLEKNGSQRKNFLLLLFLWQIVYLLLFLDILYVQHTRYYLTVFFIPFLLLGVYLEKAEKKWGSLAYFTIVSIFFIINSVSVRNWFKMVRTYASPGVQVVDLKEHINDPYYLVTYGQMQAIEEHLAVFYQENRKELVLMTPDTFYVRSLSYLLAYQDKLPVRIFSKSLQDKGKSYFFIAPLNYPARGVSFFPPEYKNKFEVVGKKSFGTLLVYQVKIKDGVADISSPDKNDNKQSNAEKGKLATKYTWNQFFEYLKGNDK